tara:strand:+ start:76 stop:507 length:432 start_codon:yes stop_codon:yes gene_type:complete
MKNLKDLFNKNELIMYSTEGCGYCGQVKEVLEKNEITFTEKLTTEYPQEWTNITALTGLPVTPCIYYKNKYFLPVRDFPNPETLVMILKNFKQTAKYNVNEAMFEHLKTLNHHMNMAMQRLDQRLQAIEEKLPKNKKSNKKKK